MSKGCAFGSATLYSPGPQCDGYTRRAMLPPCRAISRMLCEPWRGRVATMQKTDAARTVVGPEREPRLTQEVDDSGGRGRVETGEAHRRDRPVGPPDVVVEDVV